MLKKGFLFASVCMLLARPVNANSRLTFETKGALFVHMGQSKFDTIGEPILPAEDMERRCLKVACPGTCRSSTIGFLGAEISYRVSDRLSMNFGAYMGYGSIEYEVMSSERLTENSFDMFVYKLKCHLPVLIGPRYEFYNSGSANLGVGFGVGVSTWRARARLESSVPYYYAACWSDFGASAVGTLGLDLALKLSAAAHLKLALDYSMLGRPSLKLCSIGLSATEKVERKFEPGPIHGLSIKVGISFEF